MKQKLFLICGPTASGKTARAIEAAQTLGTEIVSADSMQIYRRLSAGTAKPTAQEFALARHHLVDFVDPRESYSAATYRQDFEKCLEQHFQSGERRIPVVCGGTGLYFNSFLYDYDFSSACGGGEIRRELEERMAREGRAKLFSELTAIDPETARTLSENDEKRVIRALEIFRLTGRKKSETKPKLSDKYDFTVFLLQTDRELLYKRINERVLRMIDNGLEQEVRELLADGIDERFQCMQAIGYKEMLRHIRGGETLAEAVEEIQRATRNYAKRQITWFKRMPNLHTIDASDPGACQKMIDIFHKEHRI